MSDNVKAIRPNIEITEDVTRELLRYVEQKLAAILADGQEPKGLAFVVFCDVGGRIGTRTHWDLEHVNGPGSFAMAYAADRMKIEAHGLAQED